MVRLNSFFKTIVDSYLFPEIQRRVAALKEKRPGASLLNLGVGDVTQPLPPTLLAALCAGAEEMGEEESFKGYGPCIGYPFLREAIARHDFGHLGIGADEIFISNGAKCDLANLQEIISPESAALIPDPTYPLYSDASGMAGRPRHYLPCLEANGFIPEPPKQPFELIYLCSPNNPTGIAMTRKDLCRWVEYAIQHQALILFDAAYEAYIVSEDCPHSIYEIEGAKQVAIEIRSFSKTAGFTNLRCSYSVVPKELTGRLDGDEIPLQRLWRRRHETTFGGVPHLIQRAAAAAYTPEGKKELQEQLLIYRERRRFLREGLQALGLTIYGGIDSPYIWCKTPSSYTSWEWFDLLLDKAGLISAPGSGFGPSGEGYVRFSTFSDAKTLAESLLRLKQL